jgi:quercetin dioxygenase-like cupin family protein
VSQQEPTSHLFAGVTEPSPDELPFQPVWANWGEIASFSPTAGASMQPVAGGKLMMVRVTIEPNIDYPHHQHPHEQMGMIVEGALELTMGEETRLLRPGDVYAIPPMLPHKARTYAEGCVCVDVFTPPRDDYRGATR